jgi:single-strand DNA-binding protein
MTLNQILLIGNAGRDAELRYTQNGTAVTNFSMAVNRRYQLREEMREDTEWFNVSTWQRQAEFVAERVKRGTRVFVDGRLSTREYTAGNGESRISLDVNASRVIALSPRDGDDVNPGPNHPIGDDEPRSTNAYAANGHVTSEYAPASTAHTQSTGGLENLPW